MEAFEPPSRVPTPRGDQEWSIFDSEIPMRSLLLWILRVGSVLAAFATIVAISWFYLFGNLLDHELTKSLEKAFGNPPTWMK